MSAQVIGLRSGLLFVLCGFGAPALAKTYTFDSSKLKITLASGQSGFQVSEREHEGRVLVTNQGTFFNASATSTRVLSVRKGHGFLEATLRGGEDDKKIIERFEFSSPEVIEVTISPEKFFPEALEERFEDDPQQHYYGVWETVHGGNLDNRGAASEFSGTIAGDGVYYSSGRAPFYVTSKKYGIYIRSLVTGRFSFGVGGSTSFSSQQADTSDLKYDIIYGPSYGEIFARYNQMAGPAFLPPLWAFDTGWWRDDAHEAYHGKVANAQENVMDDAAHLEANRIRASWFWIDRPFGTGTEGWGNFDFDPSFPNPSGMIHDLGARGYKILTWIANKAWSPNTLYQEALTKGYLFSAQSGSAVNVEKPAAYNWFRAKLEKFTDSGIRGYKIDRGEEVEDLVPASFRNSANIAFARLAAESLERHYGSDYYVFARNLNDTARKYAALWNGDSICSFDGLKSTIKNGLRAGAINFPMWGSDTGGYRCGETPKELLSRWMGVSAYSPMMEVLIGAKRTPWYEYDAEMIEITRHFAEMHHDLIPYTRSAMYHATRTGMPVMRALVFVYPDDPKLADMADEYLYGSELLVAPVVEDGAVSRPVYFPEGLWLDNGNKRTIYYGKTTVTVSAPLATVPAFVREGAIIPRGDILKGNDTWTRDWSPHLRLEIFPGRLASRFDYFTGKKVSSIHVKPTGEGMEIGIGALEVPGEIDVYCQNVQGVTKDGTLLDPSKDYSFDPARKLLRVKFEGPTTFILQGAKSIFKLNNENMSPEDSPTI